MGPVSGAAYIPAADEVPEGMVHAGWYCTGRKSPDADPDGCIKTLDDVESTGPDGEVHLFDGNHHASWVPLYVKREDIA